ncbi:hypothetical protein G5V57_02770 [Nordella sp. HKS 07]|uniref:TPM domain-containing protein n=1 Tax=Nordella sp. HKS 07 TaxID=2712222 RepID=UPI0013E0EE09|nr:TPM domain-containing protein [Nordella sp. HKS 07]QIG46768.1 hypothetical protein G5V57_02770 [Nordella sp. HKS 07]
MSTTIVTDNDRERIKAAIQSAERTTSGEIVVVVAYRSDDYLHVPLHVATAAALAVPLLLPLVSRFLHWYPTPIAWVFVYQLVTFIVVALALSIPPLRYYITPRALMRKYAHRHASAQFLASNIHTTRARTGVLIFVSLLERYCEIVADIAVSEKVPKRTWRVIIDQILPRIKAGDLAAGLETGIARCAEHLSKHFPPGALNLNELPDHLIVIRG